jgi:hypothetical protein
MFKTEEGMTFSQLTNTNRILIKDRKITTEEFFVERLLLAFSVRATPGDGLKEEIRDYILPEIKETWPNVSVKSIFTAARLANQGKLTNENGTELVLYATITPASVSNLIRAYQKYFKSSISDMMKNQTLYLENPKKAKPEIDVFNDFIEEAFDAVKAGGIFRKAGIDVFMFDFLVKNGKIKDCEDFMEDALEEAIIDMQRQSIDPNKRNKRFEFRALLESLQDQEQDQTGRTLNRAKILALTNYIRECIIEEIEPKQIL